MAANKFHIHIKTSAPIEVENELKEVAYIMTGLRHHTKIWQEQYGATNRNNMRLWEQKADEWIKKHKVIIE